MAKTGGGLHGGLLASSGPLCEAVFLTLPRTQGGRLFQQPFACERAHNHKQAGDVPPAARLPLVNEGTWGNLQLRC